MGSLVAEAAASDVFSVSRAEMGSGGRRDDAHLGGGGDRRRMHAVSGHVVVYLLARQHPRPYRHALQCRGRIRGCERHRGHGGRPRAAAQSTTLTSTFSTPAPAPALTPTKSTSPQVRPFPEHHLPGHAYRSADNPRMNQPTTTWRCIANGRKSN